MSAVCHPQVGPRLQEVGCREESPSPLRLYQGPLQEEYGCNALVLVGGQSAVPAAAAEATLGLRVQLELGAHGAVLPALLLPGQTGVVLWEEITVTLPLWPGVGPACGPARSLPGSPSPAAGRTGSPAPGSASRGSGSAHVPSAAGDMSSRSSPLRSRPGAGPRAGSTRRTPSLQRQDHGAWVPGAHRLGSLDRPERWAPEGRLWGQCFSSPGRCGHTVSPAWPRPNCPSYK